LPRAPRGGKLVRDAEIIMGPRTVAASFALSLLVGAALAATGDALIVTGNGVNVRAAPSGDAAVRMRVHRGQQVIELQREGSWVRAEIAGTDGQEGWIHVSLLGPANGAATETPAPAPAAPVATQEQTPPLQVEPAAGPTGDLARFRATVSYLNQRAMALAGAELFAAVEPGAEGEVRVVATEAWSNLPPAGRQSYANTLLDRWAATKASAGAAVLRIVDPDGEVVMEKTRP
jgi:hypothetical protein